MPHKILNKEQLELLVEKGLPQRGIARDLGTVQSDVRYWLTHYSLKTRVNRLDHEHWCKCGEKDPSRFHPKRKSLCKACHNRETIERFRDYKRRAVEYKGNSCQTCGYPVLVALMFHHLDPALKPLNWSQLRTHAFEKIKDELDKTILICFNCHAEIHYGDEDSTVRKKFEEIVGKELAELTYYYRDREKKNALQRGRRLVKTVVDQPENLQDSSVGLI